MTNIKTSRESSTREKTTRKITLDVSFISKSLKGFIITDSDNAKNFVKKDVDFSKFINIIMQPHGGFVIKTF